MEKKKWFSSSLEDNLCQRDIPAIDQPSTNCWVDELWRWIKHICSVIKPEEPDLISTTPKVCWIILTRLDSNLRRNWLYFMAADGVPIGRGVENHRKSPSTPKTPLNHQKVKSLCPANSIKKHKEMYFLPWTFGFNTADLTVAVPLARDLKLCLHNHWSGCFTHLLFSWLLQNGSVRGGDRH